MSRYVITTPEGHEIAYGFDHACGYFLQVWEPGQGPHDDPAIDLDSTFHQLTGKKLFEKLQRLTKERFMHLRPGHAEQMLLDLPIGEETLEEFADLIIKFIEGEDEPSEVHRI